MIADTLSYRQNAYFATYNSLSHNDETLCSKNDDGKEKNANIAKVRYSIPDSNNF